MPSSSNLSPEAPNDPVAVPYDQMHLALYAALLDADAAGQTWIEMSEILMGLNPNDPGARACWASHLRRARWIVSDGLDAAIMTFSHLH